MRRRLAASLPVAGDFAVPSLANPVFVDPNFADFRENDSAVKRAGGAFVDYWSAIWDIMTGNNDPETETENLTEEQKIAVQQQSSGDNGLLIVFVVFIGALYFLKKRG
jgi:hypothetical protein